MVSHKGKIYKCSGYIKNISPGDSGYSMCWEYVENKDNKGAWKNNKDYY